jgi:predicted HTH transcriptional regulator
VEPSSADLQALYNLFGYVLTEERLIEGSHPGDIDERAFEAYMARLGLDLLDEPRLSLEDDLRIRGILGLQGGVARVSLYGAMAFGRNPQKYPQTRSFWIECVAYAGADRADEVLQAAECTGRLEEQVDRALGWFRSIGRNEHYGAVLRRDVPRVPEGALREALVNAVCHRDYAILGSKILLEVFDDRVDISSLGSLPNHMTPLSATAGGHPRSRNELMATFMLTLGYMEGRGRGWPRMRRLMRAHNGTVPALIEDRESRWVRVSFDTRVPESGTAST